jgi:hypothetical protein
VLLRTPGSDLLCSHASAATISVSLGILFTYIAKGQTSTNSKHISHDPYLLLLCDVTTSAPAAGHMEKTACSTVVCVYRVYSAIAWQHIDQIC